MKPISCLILEPDPDSASRISELCRALGTVDVRWNAKSVPDGIEIMRKHQPELTLWSLNGHAESSIEAVGRMAHDFPGLYLVAMSERGDADIILKTIRAGAHDFLRKPVAAEDLRAATEKALKVRPPLREEAGGGGRVVSVFSNKGGNGTTTIAVNLADALVRSQGKKVVLVDLVLAHGDLTMFFNANPVYSILDLARSAEKADQEFLHSLLLKHDSGVYILADPPMIEDAEQITAAQVKEILAALRSMFDFVIVDTPHLFDERTLTTLDMSDDILLVSLLDLPALRNTQKCLDLFGRIGLRDERIRLVLSRYLPGGEITPQRVAQILGCEVFFAVPNDYPTVISSINRGRLLGDIASGKEVTESFRKMSALLANRGKGVPAAPAKKRGVFGRLLGHERSRT